MKNDISNDLKISNQVNLKKKDILPEPPKDKTLNIKQYNSPKPKKKLLCWSDAATSTTGFGKVSKYILKALHETGEYEIDQLAINFTGKFYDREQYPYTIISSKLGDPNDPYGNQMFADALLEKEYDLVFIINDTGVVESMAHKLDEIRKAKRDANKKPFKVIYYYPIDSRLPPFAKTMLEKADCSVSYTSFGLFETQRILPKAKFPIIYHGTDTKVYRPLTKESKRECRKRLFKIEDDETFLWINVNRNSIRKDMARTLLAFSEFKKVVPNTKLYLHTLIVERSYGSHPLNLKVPMQELGLDPTKDVAFPNPEKYKPVSGYPEELLNQLYNCANGYITTSLGEGFGMTTMEAMAAMIPCVCPKHTSLQEILNNGRGYLYPCKERVFVENTGFRHFAHVEDIVQGMLDCWQNWKDETGQHQLIISSARKFTEKYSWENICKQWIDLFDKVYHTKTTSVKENLVEVL